MAPFVLAISLPKCTPNIIDFLRDSTIRVDGVGYVCSFSVFGAETSNDIPVGISNRSSSAADPLQNTNAQTNVQYRTNQEKMQKSCIHFASENPHWQPRDMPISTNPPERPPFHSTNQTESMPTTSLPSNTVNDRLDSASVLLLADPFEIESAD